MRMINDDGCPFVPFFRIDINSGREINFSFIEGRFYLDQSFTLTIKLISPVVDQAVSYSLHDDMIKGFHKNNCLRFL